MSCMGRAVEPSALAGAIQNELTIYSHNVDDAVDKAAKDAMEKLVTRTRATAPVGARGSFKRSITSKKEAVTRGTKYVWYVKAPDHRLTHLLVHGHATKDGGRTRSDPFLVNAVETVLPEYENEVKEAIRRGGG